MKANIKAQKGFWKNNNNNKDYLGHKTMRKNKYYTKA